MRAGRPFRRALVLGALATSSLWASAARATVESPHARGASNREGPTFAVGQRAVTIVDTRLRQHTEVPGVARLEEGEGSVAVGESIPPAGSADAPARSPARPQRYRVVLRYSGDEYEDAQNNPLNNTNGICPPSHDVPTVNAMCWRWSAERLGRGTYSALFSKLEGLNLTWTFTYTDSHGDALTGYGHAVLNADPTPPHEPGHVNRWQEVTETFTGGTGRYVGVSGVLRGTTTTVVTSVDPTTGIAHKKVTNKEVGTLTFPSKLESHRV